MNKVKTDIVRVRFAPSPTGNLHIGGLRAALFNNIFALQNNGKFLLRIEDTDTIRSEEKYTKAIIDAFAWCNMKSDEPLVYQSKRTEIYNNYIEKLLSVNAVYWSEEPNEEGIVGKVLKCRVNKNIEYIECNDIIRGLIKFPTSELEDFIIVRSDRTPLYNFVVVIDDIEMKISHIIRGEEHLSNTPKQIILYDALNAHIPKFAHLPLILSPDGKKLSKRDAATAVIDYKEMGFLPEALCMYLIRLGWAYKDQEIFTEEELIKYFDLSKVHSAGAIFDIKKLLWMNSIFIKKSSNEKLLELIYENFKSKNLIFCENWNKEKILSFIELYKDRSETILQLADFIHKIYDFNSIFDAKILEILQLNKEDLKSLVVDFKNNINEKSFYELKNIFNLLSEKYKIELSSLFKLIRYIILGEFSSPSIYKIIEILETQEVLKRIDFFIKNI